MIQKPFDDYPINVITITRNNPNDFKVTSESLRNQSCNDFNWIIQDGSSSDLYAESLSSWCSRRVYLNTTDHGIYDAMNRALLASPPGWTLFLNSGDSLSSTNVIHQLYSNIGELQENGSASIILCGGSLHEWPNKKIIHVKPKELSRCRGVFSYRIPTVHQSMLFSPFLSSKMLYDTTYQICGDGELFWRCIDSGARVVYCPIIISKFKHGGKSLFYDGFLKQSEALRFARKYTECSFSSCALMVTFSAATTMMHRFYFYYKTMGESFCAGSLLSFNIKLLAMRVFKLLTLASSPSRWFLFRRRVLPGYEHRPILSLISADQIDAIVDVGANKGQFSLFASLIFPNVPILAIEPIPSVFNKLKQTLIRIKNARTLQVALSDTRSHEPMFCLERLDSSSLLPCTIEQEHFYNTGKVITTIQVNTIKGVDLFSDNLVDCSSGLLKIDVQGGEKLVLDGFEDSIKYFKFIYIELSCRELYDGQLTASHLISYLHRHGYELRDICNIDRRRNVGMIQADFLFSRNLID